MIKLNLVTYHQQEQSENINFTQNVATVRMEGLDFHAVLCGTRREQLSQCKPSATSDQHDGLSSDRSVCSRKISLE